MLYSIKIPIQIFIGGCILLNKFKPGEILLSLAKPNKKKIANIADFSNVSLNLSFADLNDLSFNIPLKARYNF